MRNAGWGWLRRLTRRSRTSDGEGEFSFYYIPPECIEEEFTIVVHSFGHRPEIMGGLRVARGVCTTSEVLLSRR